jgi:hypothetical protein
VATPRRISDIRPLFTNLAQTSHYEVKFGGLPDPLTQYLRQRGISSRFIAEDAGLLCNNAVLPTTQLATAEISGNYIGITESFAHRRQYQDITLEFYVDKNYNTLKFLEHWMEFIASGSSNPIDSSISPINSNVDTGYFIRMQYPEYYKSNKTRIIKFDRDYRREIEYTFIGLYPYSISSIPVSYSQSDVMKMSATFKMDRYVIGRSLSINVFRNENNNKESIEPKQKAPTNQAPRRLVPISPGSAPAGGIRFVDPNSSPYQRATQQYYDAQGTRRAP